MIQSIGFKQIFVLAAISASMVISTQAYGDEGDKKSPTFSIAGQGIVKGEPDIAHIRSGVVTDGKTPEEALSKNTEKMASVFDLLAEQNVSKQDVQTVHFNVEPQYRHHNPRPGELRKPPVIVGYIVRNEISVKVTDLANLGVVLSQLVSAGANELGSIQFAVSSRREKLDEARVLAFNDAKKKAELYMKAAGTKLGRIVGISEGARSPIQRKVFQARAVEAAASYDAAPVPIAGGSTEISVQVSVTWEIDQ